MKVRWDSVLLAKPRDGLDNRESQFPKHFHRLKNQ